jgi:hypothetical protein
MLSLPDFQDRPTPNPSRKREGDWLRHLRPSRLREGSGVGT